MRMLWEHLSENTASLATGGSAVALAGLDITGHLEQMPVRWLAALVVVMFGAILALARRDYARINATLETNTKAISEATKSADKRHAELQREIGECVKHTDNAKSFSRVHAKLNRVSNRVTSLETKGGMYRDA